MTQQTAARQGARPLALLACALLALCTASCAFIPGGTGNQSAPQVKSVEAFQHDLEPTIIAARNELVTAENFMAYKDNYSIAWSGLVLWAGCFEGCWLLLVVLCPLARVLVG